MKKCFSVILAFLLIGMAITGCSSRQKGEPITANVYRFTPYADWEIDTENPSNGPDYYGVTFQIKPSGARLSVNYTDRTVHTNVPEAKKKAELLGESVGTIVYENIEKDEPVIAGRQMYHAVMRGINADTDTDQWMHIYCFDTENGIGEISIVYDTHADYDPQEDLSQVLHSLEFLEG